MTRDETKELLMMIRAIYPNFNVKTEEMTPTINAWHMMLEEYPKDAAVAALQIYVKTNNTGFAPSVSQLIGSMYSVGKNELLTEGEAWALVKKAISDGNYHAEERFNELPEIVQKAVGSPTMIHQWAGCETTEVNTVVMSNFERNYRAVCEKQDFGNKVPTALADVVKGVIEKNETKMIGARND